MNIARNADQVARKCKRFVYSVVKITRFYGYQTWPTCWFKYAKACVCGLFFLDYGFWLGRQTPVTWKCKTHFLISGVKNGL